jgi:hypothetical protein
MDKKSRLETLTIYIKYDQQEWVRSILGFDQKSSVSPIKKFSLPQYEYNFVIVDSIITSDIDILKKEDDPKSQLKKAIDKFTNIKYVGSSNSSCNSPLKVSHQLITDFM